MTSVDAHRPRMEESTQTCDEKRVAEEDSSTEESGEPWSCGCLEAMVWLSWQIMPELKKKAFKGGAERGLCHSVFFLFCVLLGRLRLTYRSS